MKPKNPSQPQKPKSKPLEISPKDLAKAKARKERLTASSIHVEPEWMVLVEFAYYFGWEAFEKARASKISLDLVETMLKGAKKIRAGEVIDMAHAVFAGEAASRSEKPQKTFDETMEDFIKRNKVDA